MAYCARLAEVAAWHALLATLFGRLVVLKIALLAVLAALGAYNRFRAVPAVDEDRMLRECCVAWEASSSASPRSPSSLQRC